MAQRSGASTEGLLAETRSAAPGTIDSHYATLNVASLAAFPADDDAPSHALGLSLPPIAEQVVPGARSGELTRDWLEAFSDSVHRDVIVGGLAGDPIADEAADARGALPGDFRFYYFGEAPAIDDLASQLPGHDPFESAPGSPISAAVDAVLSGGTHGTATSAPIFDDGAHSGLGLGAVADQIMAAHAPVTDGDFHLRYALAAFDGGIDDLGLGALSFDRPIKEPVPGDTGL